ncbi:MAG: hypothetical protein V3T08_09590 [Gemmatimonadota bacterium]
MPNKILGARGTRITFEASGGTVVLTLTSVASGAGRISATHDKTGGSQEKRFGGGLRTQIATTPVAADIIRIYLIEQWEASNGGSPAFKVPGDLPSTDSAIADEDRFKAGGILIGRLIVPPSPAQDVEYVSLPFDFETRAQKFQIGVWNASAVALTSTATEHEVWLEDVDDEIQ